MATPTIIDTIRDPHLFAPWFKEPNSWCAWRAFLCALFGLSMSKEALTIYQRHTGRIELPAKPFNEAWLVVGRRGGKSFITALVAVYLACFFDYRKYLSPGERGAVMVLASDRKQSRVIIGYVKALLKQVPMLDRLVIRSTSEGIELKNNITIEVQTAAFRSVRGYTVVCALLDEIAFWRNEESANPDAEIVNALRPAMATIPNSLLIGLSSPYAKRGVLFEAYREHYGQESDVLVWQADTKSMNPNVPHSIIDRAYKRDSVSASSEYGAVFRNDVETFIDFDAVVATIVTGMLELPYLSSNSYRGFVDPSGGSRDSFTLAIAHNENGIAVLDCIIERKPPFSPEAVVKEFSSTLKRYHINTVHGDRYGGFFPRELFNKESINYKVSELTRSDLYLELLPAIMCGKIQLLDNRKLINQICLLERRTARSGKDSVDHPPGAHDDIANSAAGALYLAKKQPKKVICEAFNQFEILDNLYLTNGLSYDV
ncbi:MAG: hypothetical protein AB2793_09730 [Candidatus Thiodiazotropha sp.]